MQASTGLQVRRGRPSAALLPPAPPLLTSSRGEKAASCLTLVVWWWLHLRHSSTWLLTHCGGTGGAAAAVTLSGYFSIMASCPGRPLWMYWEKSAGPPPARAEEAEESGGRVCLLRRSGWGPHWEEQAQSTGLDFLLFCSRSPLLASSKETEPGPPSQSSG